MRMSRKSLLAYDRLVGAAGDRAATAYQRLLSLWISNNPQATENEIINAAAYFACTTLNDYGEAAAAAADELCRQLAAQDKISGTTHTDYAPDRKEIGKILGSQKCREPLAQGDRTKFVTLSSDRVKDECHRAANKQMLKSAKALGCKRYARVPVGDSKTCKFCVSVAANGFHGLTEEGAKKLTRLHDNCRCKVIPGFGKNSSVEGYDPEEYKEAYELRKKLEQEGYSVAQIQRAMAGEPVGNLGAPNSGKGGRPKKQTRKTVNDLENKRSHLKPANKAFLNARIKEMEKLGVIVQVGTEEAYEHLNFNGADAMTIDDVVYFRENPTISEILEEEFHIHQWKRDRIPDYRIEVVSVLFEIEAQEYLLSVAKRYRIPRIETEQTIEALKEYKHTLEQWREHGDYDGRGLLDSK